MRVFFRFIPTNVGNTRNLRVLLQVIEVHPHERGEYIPGVPCQGGRPGSSPRTWGIRYGPSTTMTETRFIPTNVGNTQAMHVRTPGNAVHPHERGEYLLRRRQRRQTRRFIPTNVGNTIALTMVTQDSPVHPHERGEYDYVDRLDGCFRGSSPRTWGILWCGRQHSLLRRFIPTNVGNTKQVRRGPFQFAVHPHERGEYGVPRDDQLPVGGSSPRTWGIRPMGG